jgi:hypothetical protein
MVTSKFSGQSASGVARAPWAALALLLAACARDEPSGEAPCVAGDPWCAPVMSADSAVANDAGTGPRQDGSPSALDSGGQASKDASAPGSSDGGGASSDGGMTDHDGSGGASDASGSSDAASADGQLDSGDSGTPPPDAQPPGQCEQGSGSTAWATSCPTSGSACAPGTWTAWGSSSPENYPFRYETEHFAFYWPDGRTGPSGAALTRADAEVAGKYLEEVVWPGYMGSPVFWPEPDCNSASKRKVSIHIIDGGLYGGCNQGRPGMWIGAGGLADHWGLAHEFMHSMQCMQPGFADCGAGGCWIAESHANFMPHQLSEFRGNVHCSEMLVNAPHLYYGSTRDRYCNWQFFEFIKDKYCYRAVNEMWTTNAPSGQRDPWNKLALSRSWSVEQLNDEFGEWAMHNVTWDYKNPPPTQGNKQDSVYRGAYAAIDNKQYTERRLRLTALAPLDADWKQNRRFVVPSAWAPQRWGYNVIKLVPEPGATSVRVKFRGVIQQAASSGFRWGLVATDTAITTPRYSSLQRGTDGELQFCVQPDQALWLVVVATPTAIQKVIWDQAYPSIYRYPYMVELTGAWPENHAGGQLGACPAGTARHSNGNGCATSSTPASVFVGPYAQVLGGSVSGSARIEDNAVIVSGNVSGGTVGALSLIGTVNHPGVVSARSFNVSGSAKVMTSFYPLGFFAAGQSVSGSATLLGDVELQEANASKTGNIHYGFVDASSAGVSSVSDVTVAPPYTWRP